MPLLKRKEKALIPPVLPSTSKSSFKSNTNPEYTEPSTDTYRDKYSRSQGVGDIYSRPGADSKLEEDRNELFSGYNPQKAGSGGSGRFLDGPEVGKNEDENVEEIKKQTRYVKQESVNSTRNALRMAREAEETARGTLGRLGDQSEKLANTEMHLDVAKGHSTRAHDQTDELKQLNKSIFRPVITFNKDAKRRAADAKIQERYEEERAEREKAMLDVRETQNRLGRAQTYGLGHRKDEDDDEGERIRNKYRSQEQKAHRNRFQFEASASDDEMEDELDKNLDEIGDVTKKLRTMGMAMNQELTKQNERIGVIGEKSDNLGVKLTSVTYRQKKIK